jgi:hypothetical protein
MKKYMILTAVMLAGGLYLYLNAASSSSSTQQDFIQLEIPQVGWSVKYDTSNMVKVHKDSEEYVCKGTVFQMFTSQGSSSVSSIAVTGGTGFSGGPGTCLFISEDAGGNPIIGQSPTYGPAYYLTGKDYFGWTPYTGTIPTNAVSGGLLRMAPTFICRVNLGVEGYKAGVYDMLQKQCTVPFQGAVKLSSEFDILVFEASCKK